MGSVAALVLAAGEGRRFVAAGGTTPKVLAPLAGRPLLSHVIALTGRAGLDPVLVVMPEGDEVLAAMGAHPDVRIVVNPDPTAGPAASLAAGLAAFGPSDADVEACVVLLADQPLIDPAVVLEVVAACRRAGRPARARYDDGPGHPVVLPSTDWAALSAALRGSADPARGARALLADLGCIEVAIPGPMPIDVDEPDDLRRIGGAA
jgi:CTP:molybdopterin cytidylyltransferase MocA